MTQQQAPRKRSEPSVGRPYMPDYGVLDAQSGQGLLPWSWATERLTQSQIYWIATTYPDGRPHVMPVWGIWLDEAFYFSSGPRSRKTRNLAMDPRCTVSSELNHEVVILEGVAKQVNNPLLLKRFAGVYSTKYQYPMEPTQDGVRDDHGNSGPVFAVHPRLAFGFGEDLTGIATRWSFEDKI